MVRVAEPLPLIGATVSHDGGDGTVHEQLADAVTVSVVEPPLCAIGPSRSDDNCGWHNVSSQVPIYVHGLLSRPLALTRTIARDPVGEAAVMRVLVQLSGVTATPLNVN